MLQIFFKMCGPDILLCGRRNLVLLLISLSPSPVLGCCNPYELPKVWIARGAEQLYHRKDQTETLMPENDEFAEWTKNDAQSDLAMGTSAMEVRLNLRIQVSRRENHKDNLIC